MIFKLSEKNKFSLLLIFLSFTLILSQEERCTLIQHCSKCPDIKRCEICDTGYKLAIELDRCIPENEPYSLNQTLSQQNSLGPLSSNNSQNQSNSSLGSSQPVGLTNITSNVSNPPVASNNPTTSKANQGLSPLESAGTSGGSSLKSIICLVVIILVVCIICLCIRKKKGKPSYFYDESGNRDEKAKVVYIK